MDAVMRGRTKRKDDDQKEVTWATRHGWSSWSKPLASASRPDERRLRSAAARAVGDRLVVDGDRWSCSCGSGGPVELVACFGGFSMSHAAELVRSGWRPDGPPGLVTKSTVRPLPLLCDPDSDDEAVIDAVLAHYQGERRASEQAKSWLAERGVDDDLGRRAAHRVRQPHPRLPPARGQPQGRGEAARPADAPRPLPHLGT